MANLLTQIVIAVKDKSKSGIKSFQTGMDSVGRQIESVNNQVKAFFAAKFSLDGIKSLIETADNVKLLNARLKLATQSQEEFNHAQEALFEISQNTSTAVEDNVGLFAKLNRSIKDLGGNTATTLSLTDAVAKSLKLSGSNASESASLIRQLSQSLGSGVLRGDEFNSVMENGGRLAIALADGLGVTIGKLREMAEEGELTSSVVINALQSQKDILDKEFAELPVTVGDAFQRVGNEFQKYVGNADSSSQATKNLSELIQSAASNFTQLADTALYFGTVVATAYGRSALLGITNYIAAVRQSVIENQQATVAANQAAAASERQAFVAGANVVAIESEIAALRQKIATQQAALASTSQAAVGATALAAKRKQLAADTAALSALEQKLVTSTTESAAAQRAAAAASTAAAGGAQKLLTVTNGLNAAFAGLIGFEIGSWLHEQSAAVRVVGAEIAKNAHKGAAALGYLFNREWLNDGSSLDAKLAEIDKSYSQIIDNITNTAIYGAQKAKQHTKETLAEIPKITEKIKTDVDEAVKEVVNKFKDWGTATNEVSRSLNTLSNETLQKLKKEADAAFEDGIISAAQYSQILHDIVQEEVAKTGKKLDLLKTSATDAGREMELHFTNAIVSGEYTQQQIQNIANEYIQMAKTSGDLQLIVDVMKAAGIETEGTSVAAVALRRKVNDLTAAQEKHAESVKKSDKEYKKLEESGVSATDNITEAVNQLNASLQQTQAAQQQMLNVMQQIADEQIAAQERERARIQAAEDFINRGRSGTIDNDFTADQRDKISALSRDDAARFEAALAAAVEQRNIQLDRGFNQSEVNVDEIIHGIEQSSKRQSEAAAQSKSLNSNIEQLVSEVRTQNENAARRVPIAINTPSGTINASVDSADDAAKMVDFFERFQASST